jgi:flavin reductase (DIM6/NTAB) family NADH-FMN oxidoreductase RutF
MQLTHDNCLPQLMVHFSASKPIKDGEGKHKDTLNNIKTTKEFVVNMISEPFAEASKCVAL